VFPRRLEAELLLLQVVRNSLSHRYMEKRPNAVLRAMESLIARTFPRRGRSPACRISRDYAIGFTGALQAALRRRSDARSLDVRRGDGPQLARAAIESLPRAEAGALHASAAVTCFAARPALADPSSPLQPRTTST